MTSQDVRKYNWILYDGDCPFCANTFHFLKLRQNIGPVELIDARVGGPELALVQARGLDINKGTAFMHDGKLYYGDQVLHQIAMLTDENATGFSIRVNRMINRHRVVARFIYPILVMVRNWTVLAMGRERNIPD